MDKIAKAPRDKLSDRLKKLEAREKVLKEALEHRPLPAWEQEHYVKLHQDFLAGEPGKHCIPAVKDHSAFTCSCCYWRRHYLNKKLAELLATEST